MTTYRKKTIHINSRRCRVCGCTNKNCKQCIKKLGNACYWVEADLCSACQPKPKLRDYDFKKEYAAHHTFPSRLNNH